MRSRKRRCLTAAAAGGEGHGAEAWQVIDNTPPGEWAQTAVGRRILASGFLRWKEGDLGDRIWLDSRAEKLSECGRPGGPVFATIRHTGDGEIAHGLAGLLRCNLPGCCPVCSEIRGVERWEQGYRAFKAYLDSNSENNSLVHVVMTVPRAITRGHGDAAQQRWTESIALARQVWKEWATHGMRQIRQRWVVAGTLRVIERQYSSGTRWQWDPIIKKSERYGTGVHWHVHNAWAVTSDMIAAGEMAVAQCIFEIWRKCLRNVVKRARAINSNAFEWVNLDDPLKGLEQTQEGIKGAISVRFVRSGSGAKRLLKYMLKELAFGSRKEGRGKANSYSWGQLLSLAGTAKEPWARQAFRFHCASSLGERVWAWSFIEGEGQKKRSFAGKPRAKKAALDAVELGASSTPSDFGRARLKCEMVRDLRLYKSGVMSAEGVEGFQEDDRTQDEKRDELKAAADKRAAGRARYLAARGSTSSWVVEQMIRQGYSLSAAGEYVLQKHEDLGEL